MSDSGGMQQPGQPWSPAPGQPGQSPGWGQQPAPGAPPPPNYGAPQGPPPGPPPGGGYGPPSGVNPAWNAGPAPSAAPKSGIKLELMSHTWLLGAAALIATFLLAVIGDIINSFSKLLDISGGSSGRFKALQFFDFGQPAWALLPLVAIALLVFGPKIAGSGETTPTRKLLIDTVLGAGAAVVLAGLVDAILLDHVLR